MTTTDNNKLLAEFMGFQQTNIGWYDAEEVLLRAEIDNTFDNLKFHTDWNWLMQVVEKIEDLGNDVSITTNYIQIAFDEGEQFIVAEDTKIKIDTLYNACVEFVKWYNSSKEA
jgi:hypothetical protein